MDKIYVTLTGTKYYHGKEFLEPGMKLRLVKEPDNPYDKEAIRVELAPMGIIGHVANSANTVLGECYSAGRLYDKIGDKAKAKVVHVLPYGVILKICKKSLLSYEKKEKEAELVAEIEVIPHE